MSAAEIVNKVWNYAHVLRDDGVGYGDYVEQITYLIFLKMADERDKAGQQVQVPNKYAWARLVKLDGDDLELQYRHTLESLGKQGGMLGTIFRKAQNKIQDPAKLRQMLTRLRRGDLTVAEREDAIGAADRRGSRTHRRGRHWPGAFADQDREILRPPVAVHRQGLAGTF